MQIDEGEIVLRRRVAALRRILEQIGGDAQVLLHADALGDHAPERELGIGIAEIGGLGISVGRLGEVLGDAEPFRIDLAHQGEGFLGALRRLLLGELQRGQVFALEIGGVGGAFARAGRRGGIAPAATPRPGGRRAAAMHHAALLAWRMAVSISAMRFERIVVVPNALARGRRNPRRARQNCAACSASSTSQATHGTTKISDHQAISSATDRLRR